MLTIIHWKEVSLRVTHRDCEGDFSHLALFDNLYEIKFLSHQSSVKKGFAHLGKPVMFLLEMLIKPLPWNSVLLKLVDSAFTF